MAVSAIDELIHRAQKLTDEELGLLQAEITALAQARAIASATGDKSPRRSLLGLVADRGPAPSAEEIDEVRRELWANFPRDDL